MRMTTREKDERFEVNFLFTDSRSIDLDVSLHLAGNLHQWRVLETERKLDHLEYKVSEGNTFLARVYLTYGLEPPTRALFDNKPPEEQEYWRASKRTVIYVVREFLEECAGRGLVSQAQKDKAIAELNKHDRELARS